VAAIRMRLQFLPANLAWVSFFGDTPSSIRGENYFPTLDAARSALHCVGLKAVRQSVSQYRIVIKPDQEVQSVTV
jgi:hypothetical protein